MVEFVFAFLLQQDTISYQKDIQPIFKQRCSQCHNSGYWNWMEYDKAFKYKDRIKWRVWTTRSMPIGGNITEEERIKIRDWVDQGANK